MPLTNPKNKWQPKTQYYDYNYGVGMNFYQPMVDFIDNKSTGRPRKLPHLPWTEELGLSQFNPLEVRNYSQRDLSRIADKTERSVKIQQSSSRSHATSGFMIEQSVLASRISTKIQQETKKKNKLVKEINKLKSRVRDDIGYDAKRDRKAERELMAEQKFLRGKSAKSIEAQLLLSSRKNIAESIDHDLKAGQKQRVRALSEHRSVLSSSPFSDEIDLVEFKPIVLRSYSEHDLTKLSDNFEKNNRIKLGSNRLHKSSSFVLSELESMGSARVTKQIQRETRKKNKLVKEIQHVRSRIKDDIEYSPEKDKEIEQELKTQQKFLRGKSAKFITAQLLSGSNRIIAKSLEKDIEAEQSVAYSTRSTREHVKFMDERMTKQLEESFTEPLESLNQDLVGLNRKATHYFIDQR